MGARWKELCMDTTGDGRLGRFWADVLGLEFRADADDPAGGDVVAAGPDAGPDAEGKGIAMCRVPEEKSVKHRVHIDVHAESVAALVEKGARILLPAAESGFAWTVMADPEGGEFCAFPREADRLPSYRFYELSVDAEDPARIARWWADVLDAVPGQDDEHGWAWVEQVPGMPFESVVFAPVPEPKTVKNRIHWDVYGDVSELASAGATVLRAPDGDSSTGAAGGISWTVMADPEGNEFCVFER